MMLAYFILGCVAATVMVVAMAALLFMLLRSNWNHTNRSRVSFLAPVVLSIAIIWVALTQFVPRVFDIVHLVNRQYTVIEIDIPPESIGRRSIIIDDETYHYPPKAFGHDERGGRYQITYTPRTRFIVRMTRLGETEDLPDPTTP